MPDLVLTKELVVRNVPSVGSKKALCAWWINKGPSIFCTDTDSYLDAIIFLLIEGGTAKCAKSKTIC